MGGNIKVMDGIMGERGVNVKVMGGNAKVLVGVGADI